MICPENAFVRKALLVGLAALSSTACVHRQIDNAVIATASLADAAGRPSGKVSIRNDSGRYVMSVEATGLAAGSYAMHFHQTGKCDAPEFITAGTHWNPAGRQHGLANADGPHAGDLPNITATSGDRATATVNLDILLTGPSTAGAQPLFDGDGTAIVIHARADDNITDPSGNSGARILCGVLRQKTAG